MRELVELVDRCGYDSLWVRRSHLLPARHPRSAAAAGAGRRGQPAPAVRHGGLSPAAAPSDAGRQAGRDARPPERRPLHLRRRRGRRVPQGVRGLRRADQRARRRASAKAIAVLRKLWSGEPASHAGALLRHFRRRADAAAAAPARRPADLVRRPLRSRRCGAPGAWPTAGSSYVVTPEMFSRASRRSPRPRARPAADSTAASAPRTCCSPASTTPMRRRSMPRRSTLSQRYAMDFRKAAERYARAGLAAAGRRDASARSTPPAPATSSSTSSAPTRSATGRSSASPREVLPLLAACARHLPRR